MLEKFCRLRYNHAIDVMTMPPAPAGGIVTWVERLLLAEVSSAGDAGTRRERLQPGLDDRAVALNSVVSVLLAASHREVVVIVLGAGQAQRVLDGIRRVLPGERALRGRIG